MDGMGAVMQHGGAGGDAGGMSSRWGSNAAQGGWHGGLELGDVGAGVVDSRWMQIRSTGDGVIWGPPMEQIRK